MQVTWEDLLVEMYDNNNIDNETLEFRKRAKRIWHTAVGTDHPYEVVKKALDYFAERSREIVNEQSELARADSYLYKRLVYGVYPPGLVRCGYRKKWKIAKIRHSNFVTYALKQMYYYPAFHYDCVEEVAYLPVRWEYLHYKNWQLLKGANKVMAVVFSIEGFGRMYSTVLSKDIGKISDVPMSLLKIDYEKMRNWLEYPKTVHMVRYFGSDADVSIEEVDVDVFDLEISYVVPSYNIRRRSFDNLRVVSWHIERVREYREYSGSVEYAVVDSMNRFGKGRGVISPMAKLVNLAKEVNLREQYVR